MKLIDNRYELVGRLDVYPWGVRHQAADRELERHLEIIEVDGRLLDSQPYISRYLLTALGLSQLNPAGIQQVLSVRCGEDGKYYYVTYEALKGVPLADLLARRLDLRFDSLLGLHLVGRVAALLASVHGARDRISGKDLQLYHLNINPQTIFLSPEGRVTLSSFGFPRADEPSVEMLAYLAPEQAAHTTVDARADLFSLGAVAYELVTGRRAFPQTTPAELMAAQLAGRYDKTLLLQAPLDTSTAKLIENCLQAEPHERTISTSQLADQLASFLRDKLEHPQNRLREIVEKVSRSVKLETYDSRRLERVRTRSVERSDLERGKQKMNQHSSGQDDKQRRAGQETRISSVPVSERLKRAQRRGFGGSKTIIALGTLAAVLLIVVTILVIQKLGGTDSPPKPRVVELKSGSIVTAPDGVAVLLGDSVVGYTPLAFTGKEGDLLTLRHACCPDTQVVVNFDRFATEVIELSAVVEIVTSPAGAAVSINGRATEEVTPYRFSARAADTVTIGLTMQGKRALKSSPIVLAGFKEFDDKDFDVSRTPSGVLEISASFSERPKTQVTTIPSGARVEIVSSGIVVGETPLREDFGDDRAQLRITKEGFEDLLLELPALSRRNNVYRNYLFRRVDIAAYEKGNPDQTVNARLKEMIYDGRSRAGDATTPASVRVPGIDCRVVFAADGYYDVDTIITPAARQFTVVMTKREAVAEAVKEEPQAPPDAAKANLRIFVIDDNKRPIPGALVTAEYRKDREKQYFDLGRTDDDGRVQALLPPDKYKFIASHENYRTGDESKEVKAGQDYVLTIKVRRR